MFNDVLTSSKGPGIIGMGFAIVVLGGFSGLGLMVLNSDGYVEAPIEDQIKDQLVTLDGIAADISDERTAVQMYRERQDTLAKKPIYEKRLARQEKAGADLKAEGEGLNTSINALGEEWESYKESYRKNERARIKGKRMDLSKTLGADYKDVKITGANPIELRAMLSAGPRGIPYEKLPLDLQDLLQFDAEEANAYKVAIGKIEKLKGQNIAKFNKQQAQLNAAQKAAQKVKDIARKRREIQNAKLKAEAKRKEAAREDANAQREQDAVNRGRAAGRMVNLVKVRAAQSRAQRARKAATYYDREATTKQAEIEKLQRE
ncbi:hypothetical protein N9085_01450 [Akkermansiaceae bacterium]|nr:hypothetical protein [Akkermansiaceae bacterium]